MAENERGGVHRKNKYAEIKEALGIPEDEPIFILRAQDKLSKTMIDIYDMLYVTSAKLAGVSQEGMEAFSNEIAECYDEFAEFAKNNPVKTPD